MSKEDFAVSKEICFEETVVNVNSSNTKNIRILHFNDVYNIESRTTEPVGGCEYFVFSNTWHYFLI